MEVIRIEFKDALKIALQSLTTRERTVICGKRDDVDQLLENFKLNSDSPDDIIQKSLGINAQEWFLERRRELENTWDMDLSENEGEWLGVMDASQKVPLATEFAAGKPQKGLHAIKISVQEPWTIPAHLKCGGWNDCPSAEIHCAVWRLWQEKYGAEIISVSGDIIEGYVSNPPKTKEDAMELAWQQYLYCPDVVEHGAKTVSNLASAIFNHDLWFFLWE